MNKTGIFLLILATFASIAAAATPTTITVYDDTPKLPPAFYPKSVNASWPAEGSICALRDFGDGRKSWVIASKAPTTDPGSHSVGCGIFTVGTTANVSGFTEMEFVARLAIPGAPAAFSQPSSIEILVEIQDADGNKASVYVVVTTQLNKFLFPLDNFAGVDVSRLNGLVMVTILGISNNQYTKYLAIDTVKFNNRVSFKIFSDATTIATSGASGPALLHSWGEANSTGCNPSLNITYAPDGDLVLSVPTGTWGCGLSYVTLNLKRALSLKFSLKSKAPVMVEIIDVLNGKAGVQLNSTAGLWQAITIPAATFAAGGVDMTKVSWPFMITKQSDSTTPLVYVDNIRYSFV